MAFYSGLACRPADIDLLAVSSFVPEGLQPWLGGLESLVWWLGRIWFFVEEQVIVGEFDCFATGLNAIQRLEQKKRCVAVRPAGTHFSSVSRRRLMSVVFDRRLVLAFLTAWGVFFLCLTDLVDCFWLVQKNSFYGRLFRAGLPPR